MAAVGKWTETPWALTADWLIVGKGGAPVARLPSASLLAGSAMERDANAALLLAAPALFETLRFIVHSDFESVPDRSLRKAIAALQNEARYALAAAGRQS